MKWSTQGKENLLYLSEYEATLRYTERSLHIKMYTVSIFVSPNSFSDEEF